MGHPWFIQAMGQWSETLSAEEFLTRFTPIHVWWHGGGGTMNGQPLVGFLSFHHDVIKALRPCFQRSNIQFPEPWQTMEPALPENLLSQISDPLQFSQEIENWHNFVHMNPLYPELPNAATNIWTWRFWALHHRIDEEFEKCLQRHDPNENDIEKIYEKLENLHATV